MSAAGVDPVFGTASATPVLCDLVLAEAALLDARDYEAWLGLWAPTGPIRYAVPIDAEAAGRPRVAIVSDDGPRLHERIARLRSGLAYGQRPPSSTVRVLGGIQAAPGPAGEHLVRATFVLVESRAGGQQMYGGRYEYEIDGGATPRIRSKTVLLHNARDPFGNLSFVF